MQPQLAAAPDIMNDRRGHDGDQELVALILGGSEASWHAFIETYTRLIRSVIRRYVHDEDELRDVWTTVLHRLHTGLLEKYEGRSALGTWLVFVARSCAIDHLRKQRGQRRLPPEVERLPERHRRVFESIFLKGRTLEDVKTTLRADGILPEDESLAEILTRIEAELGPAVLSRLDWDVFADSIGAESGRLVRYLAHAAEEAAHKQRELNPERQYLHAEARRTLARVHREIERLPDLERRVMELKYGRGLTAPQVAEELSLSRPRAVYTIVDRALGRLRKILSGSILSIITFFVATICGNP